MLRVNVGIHICNIPIINILNLVTISLQLNNADHEIVITNLNSYSFSGLMAKKRAEL